MNDVQLVVAAPSGGVLNTASPLPTDGLPEWMLTWHSGARHPRGRGCAIAVCVPDGPFPVTVGRWEERKWCSFCDGFGCGDADHHPCWSVVGAIVQVGKVTGPSHRGDWCDNLADDIAATGTSRGQRFCHPDAAPDGFHTPVVWDQPAGAPVPCERPTEEHRVPGARHLTYGIEPAEWWAPLPARTEPS